MPNEQQEVGEPEPVLENDTMQQIIDTQLGERMIPTKTITDNYVAPGATVGSLARVYVLLIYTEGSKSPDYVPSLPIQSKAMTSYLKTKKVAKVAK